MRKIFLILTLIFVSVFNFAQSEQTAVFDGENDPLYITGKFKEKDISFSINQFFFYSEKSIVSKKRENKFIIIFTYGKNYNVVYQEEKENIQNSFKPFYLTTVNKVSKERPSLKFENIGKAEIKKIAEEEGVKNLTVSIFDVFQNKIIYQEEVNLLENMFYYIKNAEENQKKGITVNPEIYNGERNISFKSQKKIVTRTGETYSFILYYSI